MARLIDAEDFDLLVSQRSMTDVFPNWGELPEEIQDMLCAHGQYLHQLLETQPTVDAVEVVRCGNCKYYVENHYGDMVCQHTEQDGDWLDAAWINTNPDDFCSRGENKEASPDGDAK